MIRIASKEFSNALRKLSAGIEKSAFNPQSSWAKITFFKNTAALETSNFDYYVNIVADTNTEGLDDEIEVIVEAETLIPLVAKIEDEYINIEVGEGALVLFTENNKYTFPLIQSESGIEKINFDCEHTSCDMTSKDVLALSRTGIRGLDGKDVTFKRQFQQFLYCDNLGAIVFTDNIYVKLFDNEYSDEFAFLLNKTQSQILSIFEGTDKNVLVCVETATDDDKRFRVKFYTDNASVTFWVQSRSMLNEFPANKLRDMADKARSTHVVLDRSSLNKALARLMVFDKKFSSNVYDYSKIEWGTESAKFVSTKSKNYEVIPYVSSENAYEHESIIRFADLVERLKAFTSKEIDFSYGETPVLVINTDELKQMVPEIIKK